MLHTLYIFIKASLFAVVFDNTVVRLIIGLTIISFIYYFFKISKKVKIITPLSSLKIDNIYIYSIFSGLFILPILSLIFILRILNIGKTIDLHFVVKNIINCIQNNNNLFLIGNIIYYISLLMLLIKAIIFIKNKVYIYYLSLHIYMLGKEFYKEKINDLIYYDYKGITHPISIFWYNFNLSKTNLDPLLDMEAYFRFGEPYHKWFRITEFIDKYLAIIVISITIIYDIICNSFTLYITFYILPIAYIILLWTNLVNFYKTRDHQLDLKIHLLLYKPYSIVENNVMMFDTGEYIGEETRNRITRYMLNDFKYTSENYNILNDISLK